MQQVSSSPERPHGRPLTARTGDEGCMVDRWGATEEGPPKPPCPRSCCPTMCSLGPMVGGKRDEKGQVAESKIRYIPEFGSEVLDPD